MSQWPEEDEPSFWRSLWVATVFVVCIVAFVAFVMVLGMIVDTDHSKIINHFR